MSPMPPPIPADDYEFTRNGSSGFAAKYDWDLLTNGSKWRLVKGVHYESKVVTMRSAVKREAAARGLKARFNVIPENHNNSGQPEAIVVQFYIPEGETALGGGVPSGEVSAADIARAALEKQGA